ncbi:MAG: HDIG domain-containing protein [Muribaculum sp.]|nr:HDIG domain-containing protein [Muribaculaceae bacterium]MCM1081177.1 HDIG domain-containing protein [Muribaculum sp.]
MKKFVTTRIILYFVCVVLALWLMPRQQANTYKYELGKPWTYALLTAPADMPVYPDSLTATSIRDSINATFRPVYRRDNNIEKQAIADFADRINNADSLHLTPGQRNSLIASLTALLENGIVDSETYAAIRSGSLPQVRFIHDDVAISAPTKDYLSPREAYSRIDSIYASDGASRQAIVALGMSQFMKPNIFPDTLRSKQLYNDVMQKAMAPVGVIMEGMKIIDRGEIITPQVYTNLQTYEKIAHRHAPTQMNMHHYPMAGQALYIMLVFGGIYLFLYVFRNRIFNSDRALVFLMTLAVTCLLLAYVMSEAFANGLYLMPFTIIPILIVVFFDGRTAFFVYVSEILLAMLVCTYPLEFIFTQWTAGVVALCSMKELSRRSQLVRTAGYVFVTYVLAYVAIQTIQTGTIERIAPRMIGLFAINSLFISFAYVLVFVAEKLFGFVSSVTLVELSDVNNPLLRELSEECPGTFQHSMQVSNLASEAAHRIGANVQLVRTGAMYHDIGKINNPAFFTENQHGVNPHDALDPMQSARVVIGHVSHGLRRAEREKLPVVIRDFIAQHHGRGKAMYFYNTYANAHPDEEVDPAPFTYPGPNPQTVEASVLMMADAVEAASRSLKDHTAESISALVNKIIDSQIAQGLHKESPISFRDVETVKQAFIERLRTIYHARISYPDLKKDIAKEQN